MIFNKYIAQLFSLILKLVNCQPFFSFTDFIFFYLSGDNPEPDKSFAGVLHGLVKLNP